MFQHTPRPVSVALSTLLLLLLVGTPAGAGPGPADEGGGAPIFGGGEYAGTVTARLLSEREAIAPGETFTLGVEIRMQEGWHTYWENGGDAGLPTTIEWSLPDGFRAGGIQWPVPHRYAEEGDVVTFGYGDRTLLLVDVEAPADLEPGTRVEIAGRVDWLQCKDICIPGGADVSLRLPVESEPRPAPEPVLAAFEAARAEHPRPISALERVAVRSFQSVDEIEPGTEAEIAVVFSGLRGFDPDASVFFPRPSDVLWMRDGEFRSDGENIAVIIPLEVDSTVEPGATPMLPAVVEIARKDGGEPWLISFEIPVDITEAGDVPTPTNAPVFTAGAGSFVVDPDGQPAADRTAGTGGLALLRILALAFLGGVILNVMPCVLPVISLKILGFVSQAQEDPRKIFRLGLVFAGGVVVSFLVLAGAVIALQAAGEHIGWGFQFQNPVFVAGLAAVVFVFSLSLLGVFEVGGIAVMAGIGAAGAERKEYADAFFHGVLTTVLATPCTAPMLGTAIAFAFAQPAYIILLVFLTVALGLAMPYVLLSANPGWLRYVPKPGLWMDRFKQIMGFLLLATLVWLLYVFGAQTGAEGLTWLIAFLLVLGFFAWMHGAFLDLSSSWLRVGIVWGLTLVGTVGAYRSFLHEHLFPPHGSTLAGEPGHALRESVEVTDGGIVWEPFSVDYLEESVEDGHTVFIDFTADWCWTCKVNERTVLAAAEVEEAFRKNRVRTLKGDWTRKDPEITEILQRHDRAGVPFYAVYPAGRPDEVIVLPEIINKRLVIESLERAGPSAAGA
jgi:thiol:disulfide interchange protein DsbD